MRFVSTRRELPGELSVDPGDIPSGGGRPTYRLWCYFANTSMPNATQVELANDLGPRTTAGILPSGELGANAALLTSAAITLNVVVLRRMVSMSGEWLRVRMKRIKAVWTHHVGMVSRRGRRTTLDLPPAARHLALALDRLARSYAPL